MAFRRKQPDLSTEGVYVFVIKVTGKQWETVKKSLNDSIHTMTIKKNSKKVYVKLPKKVVY